jgi:penicillin-binding protein 2
VKGLHYGGKTGTAQVIGRWTDEMRRNPNLVPENFRDHSWYAGIYPADKPRYVVVVMVEHGGSGGASSAPVASKVIKRMLELGYVSTN